MDSVAQLARADFSEVKALAAVQRAGAIADLFMGKVTCPRSNQGRQRKKRAPRLLEIRNYYVLSPRTRKNVAARSRHISG